MILAWLLLINYSELDFFSLRLVDLGWLLEEVALKVVLRLLGVVKNWSHLRTTLLPICGQVSPGEAKVEVWLGKLKIFQGDSWEQVCGFIVFWTDL